ncbi:MAG: RNA polymerase sigma factor (sigma-70 family) [Patiriisocius sp.]|jgi:RNA polymerase sigma-70 factor (ECF subfamily)
MKKETNICNEQAFDTFYKEQVQSLRNFMFYKTKNQEASYDLAQEAFLKLWQNCSKVAPGKAKSYVFTIANNLFLNTVAHKKVQFKYIDGAERKVNKHTPEFLMEEKQFGEKLQKALDGLTELQRTAFLMSRIDGKKYREIAAIYNISEKAAGKRVLDALEKLRETIENL